MKSLVDTTKKGTGAADFSATPVEGALGGRSQIKFGNDFQLLVDEIAVQAVEREVRGIPRHFHLEVGDCDPANLRVADLDFVGVGAEDVAESELALIEHNSVDDAVLHCAGNRGKKSMSIHAILLFQPT